MKLLITERDPLVRRWLGAEAEALGIQTIFAKNSGEAWQAISEEPPDCVVLDASSSAEEELPLWHRLREDPSTQNIPVLLYSSSSRWQRVVDLAGTQVDRVLSRPFTPAVLLDAAQRLSVGRSALPS